MDDRSAGLLGRVPRAAPGTALPREIAETGVVLMIEGKWEAAADAWHVLEAPYERALALAAGPEEALREALAVLEQLGWVRCRRLSASSCATLARADYPAGRAPRRARTPRD